MKQIDDKGFGIETVVAGDYAAFYDEKLKYDSPKALVKRFTRPSWIPHSVKWLVPMILGIGLYIANTVPVKDSESQRKDSSLPRMDRRILLNAIAISGSAFLSLFIYAALLTGYMRREIKGGRPNEKIIQIASILLEESPMSAQQRLETVNQIAAAIYNAPNTNFSREAKSTLDRVLAAITIRNPELFNRVANGNFAANDIRVAQAVIKGYFLSNPQDWKKVLDIYGPVTNFSPDILLWIEEYKMSESTTEKYLRAKADYLEARRNKLNPQNQR